MYQDLRTCKPNLVLESPLYKCHRHTANSYQHPPPLYKYQETRCSHTGHHTMSSLSFPTPKMSYLYHRLSYRPLFNQIPYTNCPYSISYMSFQIMGLLTTSTCCGGVVDYLFLFLGLEYQLVSVSMKMFCCHRRLYSCFKWLSRMVFS